MPHCDYGVVTTSSGRLLYALQNNVAQGLHAAPSGLDLGDIANRTTRLTEGDKLQLIGVIDITAVNAIDTVSAGKLLHSQERRDCGDSGYLGIEKPDEHKHSNSGSWYITKRPGARNNLDAYQLKVEKKTKPVSVLRWSTSLGAITKFWLC